jgi:MoaA/NifB/PqqE/SkfB family radical SAM enzyme
MKNPRIEQLSIDLSNYCSKGCPFCYNRSNAKGHTAWQPEEVIRFADDCIAHEVKAVSLGGGEPFEYDGVFRVIKALYPKCYLTVTTNGLPLEDDNIWRQLIDTHPDKIHITIHQPNDSKEVKRVMHLIERLRETDIKPGLNLLVRASMIREAKAVFTEALSLLNLDQIILVPQRYSDTPKPKDLSEVAGQRPFQSPSCILRCQRPDGFCSVSWDKHVNFCSYSDGKMPLESLDYDGLINALSKIEWAKIKKCDR